jgi:predicted transcriptional regulator
MLDLDTRSAILRLQREQHGVRAIARILGVSRGAVRAVLRSGAAEVPALERDEQLSEHVDEIRALHLECRGNRVRVHEKLADGGIVVAYSTLTSFLRRHGIGEPEKVPVGHYHFEAGEEMQHDTSPHTVKIGGEERTVQCASLVLCYSRLIYAQLYRRWSRFEVRCFLTEALGYFGGAAERCMIDNSSVILAGGSGKDAIVAAEMAAFAKHFGFHFAAHALGDTNRSARVERPFHYIENNFYAGRTFASLADANAQLRGWVDAKNAAPKRALGDQIPKHLWAAELPHMRPLPRHIPEPYRLHERRVDVDAFVRLDTNRYSMPAKLIGARVSLRESLTKVRVFDGHRLVCEHERAEPGVRAVIRLPEHAYVRTRRQPKPPCEKETHLVGLAPELAELIGRIRRRRSGHTPRYVAQLHRLYVDYPTEALIAAVRDALAYDLTDLARIERMVLARIAGDFFRLPCDDRSPADD